MRFTVTYGIESQYKESTTAPTIGQILDDPTLKAVFGWSDNLRALVHGVEQPREAIVPNEGTVVVETKANCKAA